MVYSWCSVNVRLDEFFKCGADDAFPNPETREDRQQVDRQSDLMKEAQREQANMHT